MMESAANINEANTTGIFNELQIKIIYKLNCISITENLLLNIDSNLEKAFNDFRTRKNLKEAQNKQKECFFYLIRDNQKIALDKRKKIQELNLKEGDLIEITYNENMPQKSRENNKNEVYKHNILNSNTNLNEPFPTKKKNYNFIYVIIGILVFGLIVFSLWYFLSYKHKKKDSGYNHLISESDNKEEEDEEEDNGGKVNNDIIKVYQTEELITQKRPYYPNNTLFLYKSEKEMNIEIDSKIERESDENNMTKIKEYMNFGLIIKEQHQEIDEDKNMTKKWFSGYVSLLNLTINNGTNDIILIYNEQLHEYIREINPNKDSRFLEEENDSKIVGNEQEPLFAKINFYENGEIRDIFIPKKFYVPNMVHIEKIIKLIIPKLSKNLYSKNITEEIEKIEQSSNLISEEEEEISSSDSIDTYDSNIEQDIFEKENFKVAEKIENLLRRNSENDTNEDFEYSEMSSDNSDENFEKAEPEIDYSTSSNEERKYHLKGIDESETNITDFDLEDIESLQAKLDGSKLRKIKNSFIDTKGMLFSIIEYESVNITQPPQDTIGDLTEEENKFKSEIYNENNQIPRDDEEDFIGKNISFDISEIRLENKNNVSFVESINNPKLVTKFFNYFDKFSYVKYNYTENDDLNLRFLKFKDELTDNFDNNIKDSEAKVEIEHTKLIKNNSRKLQYSNTYYGMKNFEKEKVLFKYNLIGLALEGVVVSKIDVATGVTKNYFKLTLGFINFKIKFSTVQTNLHIILKNSHQMTYNFMSLLYQSNEDLITRNRIYSDILIDLEKNVTKLLEKNYDYSGLFRDSLEGLYDQVKNFSGIFFNELIELIDRVYDNYSIILNKTENTEYEIMNEIRNVTKDEYINYIENMFDIIITFENNTLIFLENVNEEVDHIQSFKLDVLYDIIDVIYDGKLVFKEFIKKLFKAVEKGVTNFKYDLRDFMEEVIGDLLYLTDFLSVNINKNDILKNAIDEESRKRVTIKLKNFRNIILRIIELFNSNIIQDYENEMSLSNNNSIKTNKENLIQNCIENINNKSDEVTNQIKEKIQYMNLYETYANNIEIINEINNKSYIEFNNDMYYNILKDINKITPEYLDNKSDFLKNKNRLFSLSNDIIYKINSEIKEINEYIESYTENYFNERKYNLDYNLYNFRKYFSNDFLNTLFVDFRSIVNESLLVHFAKIISDNYDLAFDYFNEIHSLFKKAPSYRLLGSVFIDKYSEYKGIFQEVAYLTSSDEFLYFIEDNYFNVTNYVLNYINKKIKSIKKYYFHETGGITFYALQLINQEIDSLSKNINNYFGENNLEKTIKPLIMKGALKNIPNLNKQKEKKLDDLYNIIYEMAEKEKINDDDDCEVIKLRIKKKRKWYWPFKVRYYYYYDCYKKSNKKNNINKVIKNLTLTKKYLDQKFDNFIKKFINKFDRYLNYYINFSQELYNDLNKYINGKINNDKNIEILLNDYQKIFNNILENNTLDKLFEKVNSNNLLNDSKIIDILMKLENNLFEIKNTYYQNHYLNEKKNFLEYPDEIILKLNQSTNNLKSNIESVKNKINLSLIERLKNIINSTSLFVDNINSFNLDYIISKLSTDNIFYEYYIHKVGFLNNFFKSNLKSKNEGNKSGYLNISILNEENYESFNKKIIDNYSEFLSNLTKEIDDNFTFYVCPELINSDSIQINNELNTDSDIINICSKERFSTDLNYSKYNFNIVKFRTGISNSRKFPEFFNSIFDDLNPGNIIDPKEIIKIDDLINYKNMLNILNKTNTKSKLFKNEFLPLIQETFDEFSNKFLNKTPELLTIHRELLSLFKNILNYKDKKFINNITKLNNKVIESIDKLLTDFNSTLYYIVSNKTNISYYDYYSINYNQIQIMFKNYLPLIDDSFIKSISKIKNLKSSNSFYTIPKLNLDEIFSKRMKGLEAIILNYSNSFDFDILGFNYDLSKDLYIYLKKYYLTYEFNYSYDYYELLENNKNLYLDNILKNISYIKNIIENKFNSINEKFIKYLKYLKDGAKSVEKNLINDIKINNTRCINTLINLDDKISDHLNNTNRTKFEDYIINNCTNDIIINALINGLDNDTCLNISEIDYSLFSEEIKIILECRKNNNYNYSYVIFENFEDEDKIYLNQIINNIIYIINSNIIDDKYLSNYIQNYYAKNESLQINIDDYRIYFEDIEDFNFYIYNLRENEYKELMNETLIESFNISYTNNYLYTFIKNEIMNKMNNLIYNKLNIFIEYYMNKLYEENEYYTCLLESIEELGNSSKLAIINLFSNIPKKLNESIYYLIEDDIFYCIDIFFRENKNIFIDNFIKFYLSDINNFNISIYKIREYVEEMISNKYFNKSLSNISLNLTNKVKSEIKKNIKSSLFSKINTFINNCTKIKNEIQIKLNQVMASEIPEEMANLIKLINNYNLLVSTQNNRYNFNVGQYPFDLLKNTFIKKELEPPLLLIKEKYSTIEEDLLNKIKNIADNFPDCLSHIKKNLFGNKIDIIEQNTNLINSTLLDYENDYIEDIESYINKLIHFIYIDGLKVIDEPCEDSECSIQKKSLRRLKGKSVLNFTKSKKYNYHILNKTKFQKNININLNPKRRTSSLQEYTPDMGALSEDDILYYLSELQDTTLKFRKTYFGKEYDNVNITTNKFLSKANYTHLEKLKFTFDVKLVKFSTILTENSINTLKKIILKQFYLIEDYIHKTSDLLQTKINYFLNKFNIISPFIENLNEYIYKKVVGYYKILYTSIQNKYKKIDNKRLLDDHSIEGKSVWTYQDKYTKESFLEILDVFELEIEIEIDLNELIKMCFNKSSNFLDKMKDKLNKGKSYHKNFSIPFPAIPYFEIVLKFKAYAGLGLDISFDTNLTDFKTTLSFDVFVEAKVQLGIEGGFYIPSRKSPVNICFVVGLDGIIGHGRAGIKLDFSIFEGKFELDVYFIFKALVFDFYFKIGISIKIEFFKFEYSFYIIKIRLFGIVIEVHKIKQEESKKSLKGKIFSVSQDPDDR